MSEEGDDKHEKIRVQSQARTEARTRSIFLFIFAFVSVGAFVFCRGAETTSTETGMSPVLRSSAAVTTRQSAAPVAVQSAEPIVVQPAEPIVIQPERPVVTEDMIRLVEELDAEVRRIKATGVIMERDDESLAATKKLQEATRTLMAARYGPEEPYRVEVILEFQDTIADFEEKGPDGTILLEMAPSRLVPHAVFSFLEISRQWKGRGFHRIANHVLQVQTLGKFKNLAFQEYSPEFPHKKGTVGYAGRPSGPHWYVSIMDNSRNHGPGSQQKKNRYEADSCFGKVIRGFGDDVQRIAKIPDKGFISDKRKHVIIKKMRILVPGSGPGAVDGYVEWKE
jgi:hypothetical protein